MLDQLSEAGCIFERQDKQLESLEASMKRVDLCQAKFKPKTSHKDFGVGHFLLPSSVNQ